jgi:hypothetical protein
MINKRAKMENEARGIIQGRNTAIVQNWKTPFIQDFLVVPKHLTSFQLPLMSPIVKQERNNTKATREYERQ